MNDALFRIAITPGEPAGVGPDLVIQLAQQAHNAQLIAIADPDLLTQRASQLNLPLKLNRFTPTEPATPHEPGVLSVLPVALATAVQCGQLNKRNAAYVLECLQQASDGCLSHTFDALVTGPVHKGVINSAGIPFTGHTEFLADKTHTRQVVMMLATPGLRVALATTHLPLNKVSEAITADHLKNVIHILHQSLLEQFGIQQPKILICGLNPHAGENGHLGREEIDIISPVIQQLRQQGMNLTGPLPADTLFTPDKLDQADAILTMYHDQGLPVLKHMGFGAAVNITLGLPIIRTSVDHGTALSLSGTGQAQLGSLQTALHTAIVMRQKRHFREQSMHQQQYSL